ncbi:hypothetical protein AKO1_014540 [Acrasis kona]|uniref:Uncharacterized protein n=1 Tax=Acrasis kona TaxID=1008807 RepID=A0AAW2Z253_9EUKA
MDTGYSRVEVNILPLTSSPRTPKEPKYDIFNCYRDRTEDIMLQEQDFIREEEGDLLKTIISRSRRNSESHSESL